MDSINLLVADSSEVYFKKIKDNLSDLPLSDIIQVTDIKSLYEELRKSEFDVILLGSIGTKKEILAAIKEIQKDTYYPEIIVIVEDTKMDSSIETMVLGAYDLLLRNYKPVWLKLLIKKAFEKKEIRKNNLLLQERLEKVSQFPEIISSSLKIKEIISIVDKIASTDLPVLILGESGTGKELIANAIHKGSPRNGKPFVIFNCAAIPYELSEAELFGYEKGAFTGANSIKPGMFELADGGTLFLDEIGEITPKLQAKLLRAVETGIFYRIGGTKDIKVNVRIISATNRDLQKEVDIGNFRKDLYFRLKMMDISLPPLRERIDDVALLVDYFVKNFSYGKRKIFTPEAVNALKKYSWPGNVRELKHEINKLLLLTSSDIITAKDILLSLGSKAESNILMENDDFLPLFEMEKRYILKVLKKVDGNKLKTAKILGINPSTLYRKMTGYDI